MTSQKHPHLLLGIYAATLTFFDNSQDLDLQTLRHHCSRLAKSGLSGIVTLGSNGEAVHLSTEERKLVTKTVRDTLNADGYGHLPVIVGSSAQSVKGTIDLCHEAAEAGGSHVLVLSPNYFKGAMTPEVIYDFYMTVADASPLPLVVYSFPAVVSDITMGSDLIVRISQHPNVVGTKFTCGDTGKLARVAASMKSGSSDTDKSYWAVGGLADFILPALVVGASGAIAGGANITPKICVKIYNLFQEGKFDEAMQLQSIVSQGDWVHTAAGIGGTKAALQHFFQYGGEPRLPLTLPSTAVVEALAKNMSVLMDIENSL